MKSFIIVLFTVLITSIPSFITSGKRNINDDKFVFITRDAEVKHYIQRYMLPYGQLWMKVARTESGFYCDSYSARIRKNVFGMNYPQTRPTVAIGKDKNGYAIYQSIDDAVYDLLIRIEARPPKPNESFYFYLRRTGYNPSDEYYEYLKRIKI